MLKLEALVAFVAVAEAGSISEAARRLQVSKSVVSERLLELERSIGTTLLDRTTRKRVLSEDGAAFLAHARRILGEVSQATAELAERRGELVGPLRIGAPVSFGLLHLSPALNSFLEKNPRVELSVELDDRFAGTADGFDLIVRHGPLPDNSWIVKKLSPSKRLLVASPGYLGRYGTPRSLGELAQHRGIIYSNRGASDWRFRQSSRWEVVHPKTVLRVNNGVMMRDAALSGLGITLLPTFVCNDGLATGRLQHVDVGADAEAASVFIAYPRSRRTSVKVAALIEHLCAAFRTPPQRRHSAR